MTLRLAATQRKRHAVRLPMVRTDAASFAFVQIPLGGLPIAFVEQFSSGLYQEDVSCKRCFKSHSFCLCFIMP